MNGFSGRDNIFNFSSKKTYWSSSSYKTLKNKTGFDSIEGPIFLGLGPAVSETKKTWKPSYLGLSNSLLAYVVRQMLSPTQTPFYFGLLTVQEAPFYKITPVLSLILINFSIPKIPKIDVASPQFVESDSTLGIVITKNVLHFYTHLINQKFLPLLQGCFCGVEVGC